MESLNHTDYNKILELFQAGQYVLAQQLVRKDVNNFADWLADKLIIGIKECTIICTIIFDGSLRETIYIHVVYNWLNMIVAHYNNKVYSNNFYTKIGRINALLRLKQYNKVKQKLKGVLKTLLLSAIHNKLN